MAALLGTARPSLSCYDDSNAAANAVRIILRVTTWIKRGKTIPSRFAKLKVLEFGPHHTLIGSTYSSTNFFVEPSKWIFPRKGRWLDHEPLLHRHMELAYYVHTAPFSNSFTQAKWR